MKTNSLLDPYVRRARLQPALLVALPVALAVLAWFPTDALVAGALWSFIVWSGGTALIAQVARDRGKAKEPELFAKWGGRPTARLLRHNDSANPVMVEHRHRKLALVLPNVHMPSRDEEMANPKAADAVYDACTVYLLEKTRSRDAFPLVFEANCDYGFRRNFWGMKPLGLTLAFLAAAAIGLLLYRDVATDDSIRPVPVASAVVAAALVVGWLGLFKPNWVKTTADAFAERLLAALENL
ncbi:MAG: hypothetical protein NTV05_15165 [Acidobacteria bacterium]|nr:hypothetical protein [Acidobacteriota bacterium]